jgi:hypothetical protein
VTAYAAPTPDNCTLITLAACAPRELAPANTPVPLTPTPEQVVDPDDTDGDGIPNSVDLCEGAITGASGVDPFGCPTSFDPYVNLTYNHEPHERWYVRFWTGSCEGVPGLCLPGDPAWENVSEEIAARFPEAEQGLARNRLWAIGRAVGFDWSSDPDINADKQIDTRKLRQWGSELENSADVPATLADIESEVCQLLGADALEGMLSPAAACA